MAEDIDIEEHDVLDNPIIRNIFPDISVLKKEISQYYEDVPIKQELEITTTTEKLSEDPVIHTKADEILRQVHEQSSSKNHVSLDNSESKHNEEKKPFQGNKIILGSKPNKTVEKHRNLEVNDTKGQNISVEAGVRIPKVLVQDLGKYIYESNRYCKECKTLFSSKADFHDHKLKSISIQTRNKASVKVTLKTPLADKKNKCNICNYCFSCRANLRRHFKNVHKMIMTNNDNSTKNASCIASINDTKRTLKNCDLINRTNNKNTIRTRNKQLNVKVTLEKTKLEKKVDKTLHKKQTNQNATLNKSKCTICGSYFSSRANLNRHYRNVHKKNVTLKLKYKNTYSSHNNMVLINKTTRSQSQNAKPDAKNVCFHCNKQFLDQKCLIEHIYKILEPKKHPKQKCNKILTQEKDKYYPTITKKYKEPSNTKTEEIRMKDKLKFESQDSDESESPSSETEIMRNKDFETTMNPDKMTVSTSQEKEDTERTTEDESRNLNQFSLKPFRNKRKHDSSDDNESSMEWSFLDTNATIENQPSQFNSLNKRKKLKTENKASRATSKNISKNTKLGTPNKHRPLENKKEKPKNRLLNTISKSETLGVGSPPNNNNENNLKGAFVYECLYCSYILPTPRSYCMHIFWKHKLEKIPRVNRVTFDRQCKYCPSRNTKKNHNRHIRISHYDMLNKPHKDDAEDCLLKKEAMRFQNPEFKKVEKFVLKSIVYNCSKCDIHFLSSCVAKDHEKHMELLINWKCPICKKIYKKHDKQLHLKQHKFSKTVNVCQFDQSELSRLLYNCTKCGIHFTEERYLEHYSKCGNQTTDSVYCKKCDILVDKCGYVSHETYHRTEKNTADIIVITGDIITKNQIESELSEVNKDMLNNFEKSNTKEESNSQKEKEEIETVKNEATLYSPINCLTFCQTCKCYLSDIAINRKSHVEARCSKMVKYTCPTCGLVLTNKTINTHRDHHKKEKGLKLQDFEFFDLKGIQIRPPLPEYPSCNNCEVIFVGRNAVISHICSETEYLTCEICNVKLSENAYKLHMNFHNYRMPNEKVDQSLYVVSKASQQKDIEPEKNTKSLNQNLCAGIPIDKPQAIVQTESQEHNDKLDEGTVTSNLQLCNVMLKENANNSHTDEETEYPPKIHGPCFSNIIESENKDLTDNNARSNTILYACQFCNISVDTYEKVIQHCQNHFSPNPVITLSLKMCSQCLLKFDKDNYEIHQKIHLKCDIIQVLTFDPTYFTSDNNTWTRHIFASVNPSIQKEAIEKSMYQHECRIKMEIGQQGPSYLTVYKCYRCGTFIDPECLISHINDGCHRNIGKHPCWICGLPFISSLSLTKHEKIHKLHDNVRLKSYNILLINCESHKSYNASIIKSMKQYVLYQCRTCDGIVDKLQRHDHKCNVDDLQKCPTCGLILYKDDFERHISKHSDLAMYNTGNMKVILFGNKESFPNKTLSSTFNGVISDYKLYKCSKCEDCENDDKLISRHVCTFDDSKWKCPKCGNYISARSIKQHIKMHDVHTEFNTDNFTFISFGSTKGKNKSPDGAKEIHCGNNESDNSNKHESDSKVDHVVIEHEKDCVKVKTQLDQNTTKNSENSNDQDKESIVLYKCACGLHYMYEITAKNHAKLCCPKIKIIRQNCSKCSLTFNPKELFAHILAHHGDKNKIFKYNVIEVKAEI